ncbi:MAG: Peptide deformylase [Myxococcales bacterium]|nr:Peptide deformylase [Myxococcales bacterium]
MDLPPIVQTGAGVLRARAAEVSLDRLATPELEGLIATMIDVMRAAPGVGLAAPQIGIPLRVIVLEDRPEFLTSSAEAEVREKERVAFATRAIVNPVLRTIGDTHAMFFEGCLSVDGYAALVERYREVEVTGLDEHGAPVHWRVAGWPARILQHEVDHLDGTLYVDRMLTRSFSRVEHVRQRFAGLSIAEIRAELGV